jgi:hypothetical protein
MANMERPVVRKIPMGVSGGPKELDPNDRRLEPQFEGEQRTWNQYESPSTVDRPAGPRGYQKGGKIKGNGGHTVHNYCAGGKVISSRNM